MLVCVLISNDNLSKLTENEKGRVWEKKTICYIQFSFLIID